MFKNIHQSSAMPSIAAMLALCAAADASAAPARIDVKAGESLAAVRDKARAIPAAERKDGVEIVLSAGDYILPQGMEFTAQDGAAPGAAPVVWRAEKPGEARIKGSMRVPAASFAWVTASRESVSWVTVLQIIPLSFFPSLVVTTYRP